MLIVRSWIVIFFYVCYHLFQLLSQSQNPFICTVLFLLKKKKFLSSVRSTHSQPTSSGRPSTAIAGVVLSPSVLLGVINCCYHQPLAVQSPATLTALSQIMVLDLRPQQPRRLRSVAHLVRSQEYGNTIRSRLSTTDPGPPSHSFPFDSPRVHHKSSTITQLFVRRPTSALRRKSSPRDLEVPPPAGQHQPIVQNSAAPQPRPHRRNPL